MIYYMELDKPQNDHRSFEAKSDSAAEEIARRMAGEYAIMALYREADTPDGLPLFMVIENKWPFEYW